MKSKRLDSGTVLIFETGDEVVSTLTAFARENHIAADHFTAIGAFSDAGLGYFDFKKKDYLKNQVNEQVEVVSLIGDIALDNPRFTPTSWLEKRTVRQWEGIFSKLTYARRWSLFFKTPESS